MADVVNRRVQIFIDSAAAEDAFQRLQAKTDVFSTKIAKARQEQEKLKQKIEEGKKAGENVDALEQKYTELGTRINNLNSQLKKNKEAQDTIKEQIDKGLSPSFNQLERYVTSLRNQLKNMSQDVPGYAEKFDSFKKASEQLNNLRGQFSGVEKAQASWASTFKGLTTSILVGNVIGNVISSIGSAIGSGISAVFQLRNEFEKSVSNLSAITGATGNDLAFLKKQAIDLSAETTRSATDYVEAMKLIASAKPELLSQKEALADVTKAASTLADASGLALPDAATRLTDALNQFGEPASKAAEYIDVLAAGAKYGAAEIPQITDALLQFGTQAKSSNISIQESTAVIELLAEKGIKGAEAGTKLRNIFLALNATDALDKKAIDSLSAAGVNTSILTDKSKSLEDRLAELSKIANNATALVNVFGKENFNAAQIVLQSLPRYKELNGQMQEVGTANQQAATNTNNLISAWERLKNASAALFLERENTALTGFVNMLTQAVDGIKILADNWTKITGFNGVQKFFSENGKLTAEQINKLNEEAAKGLIKATRTDANGKDITSSDGKKITNDEVLARLKTSLAFDQSAKIQALNQKNKVSADNYTKSIEKTTLAIKLLTKEITSQEQAAKKLADDQKQMEEANKAAKQKADSEKAAKKREQEGKALLEKLKAFKLELEQVGKTQDESEIARITNKYNTLIKEATKFGIKTLELETEKNRAIAFLQDKAAKEQEAKRKKQFEDDTASEYENQQKLTADFFERKKQSEAQRYANGEVDKKQYEINIGLIDLEGKRQQLQNAEDYSGVVKKAEADLLVFKKNITKEEIDDAIRKREKLVENEKLLADFKRQAALTDAKNKVALSPEGSKEQLEAKKALAKLELQFELEDLEQKRKSLIAAVTERNKQELELLIQQMEAKRKLELATISDDDPEAEKKKKAINNRYDTAINSARVESAKKTANELVSVNDTINKLIQGANSLFKQKDGESDMAYWTGKINQVLGFVQQALGILDQFNQTQTARENAELDRQMKANDKRRRSNDALAKAKSISEIEARKRNAALDAEDEKRKEELTKKQNERNKKIAIAQAVVNGALAITSILAAPTIDPTGILKGIQIAFAIATTAAQIAVIASQKFADGGKVLPNGKITATPNIPTQPNGDNVLATVRTDEVILNKKQQAALGGDATFAAIGVPGFAKGGKVVPIWKNRPYQSFDYAKVIQQQIVVKAFATGGLVGNATPKANTDNNNAITSLLQRNEQAIQYNADALNRNADVMNALLGKLEQGITTSVSLKQLDDAYDMRATIREEAGAA